MEDVEEYERIHRIASITSIAGSIIAILLNLWVISSLMSDLLGINLGRWAREVIKHGWKLPPNWVQQYQPFLTTLEWVLLFTMIIDTGISYKYTVEGEPRVPLSYLRIVSFIGFFCGLWLYLAYHVAAYGLIFFASFITFMYSMFAKSEEEEEIEEEEEFEPEIWTPQ